MAKNREKMIFKTPKPIVCKGCPVIRLNTPVASRIYEIVEQSGLTPSQVIEQMLDYIGNNWEVE